MKFSRAPIPGRSVWSEARCRSAPIGIVAIPSSASLSLSLGLTRLASRIRLAPHLSAPRRTWLLLDQRDDPTADTTRLTNVPYGLRREGR